MTNVTPGFDRLKFDDVWIGQPIVEGRNPKMYRVISIRSNPDQIVVRAVSGKNIRTIDRIGLELNWFSI